MCIRDRFSSSLGLLTLDVDSVLSKYELFLEFALLAKDGVILNGKFLLPTPFFVDVKERLRLNELSVLFLVSCCNDIEDPLLFLGNGAVSYTHLDVYKRQGLRMTSSSPEILYTYFICMYL